MDSPLVLPIILLVLGISAGLTFWKPVIGFYLCLFSAVSCEMYAGTDAISPWASLMMNNIKSLPLRATPLEILLAVTTLAAWSKASSSGQKFWITGFVPKTWLYFLGTIAFGFLWGVVIKHGDFNIALWEVRGLTYAVLFFFLASYFLQDTKRWKHVSWIFMLGVFVLIVISFLRFAAVNGNTSNIDSLNGFNHETALFFGMLVAYLLGQMAFGAWKWHKLTNFMLLLPALFSMMISNRRAAFASLIIAYIIFLVILFFRKRKAFFITLTLTVLFGVPYLAAFWNNQSSPLGMPARAIRSQISGQATARDASSDLYRIVEKFNVHYTIMQNRTTGVGFGQQFYAIVPMIQLDGFVFALYTPHANILWIWLKLGIFGFACFWLIQCLGMFQMAQVVKYARAGPHMSLTVFAGLSVIIILTFAYVDVAMSSYRITVMLGMCLAIINIHYQAIYPDLLKEGGKKLLKLNRPKPKKVYY